MNIILAEDEILERKAMRKFLEDNFPDITVVGEAANGRMAIELAEQLQPDVMLVDIKMPGINGLEAIEKIHQQNPTVKFILLTAYDSFSYAKQAMKVGVKEYILKPSKKEETVRAILRVKKEVQQEKERMEQTRHSSLIARELFLSKLMQYETSCDLEQLQKSLFPKMRSGFFIVIEGKEGETKWLETWLKQHSDAEWIIQQTEHQLILLAISEEITSKAAVLKFIRKLHLQLGGATFTGIGYPYTKLTDIPKSYHQAVHAVRQLVETQNSHYGFFANIVETKQKELVDDLILEVTAGNETNAIHFFKEIMEQMSISNNDVLQELFFKIRQALETKGVAVPTGVTVPLINEENWIDFLKLACLNVQHHYQSQNKIARVKQYVQDHYHEQVSLEDVAQLTELSPNYLSNLFKEATGETFIDYLTMIRLKKAKELLQQNQYSLKEISFMVGYKDPNYFSRVFKKHFARSPKQYVREIIKK